MGNQELRRKRADRQTAASMVMYTEKVDQACEKVWAEVDQELEAQETFSTSKEIEE